MIYNYKKDSLFLKIKKFIKKTDSVLDLGCGIRPMTFFTPKIHVLVEPFSDYVKMLQFKYADIPQIVTIQNEALNFLKTLPNKSFDSIFFLDVIEHLPKEEGKKVIKECERVAKKQIVFFTPLGFNKQDCEYEEKDAWGLSGTSVQQHRSGWLLKDFKNGYDFHVCKNFHEINWKGEKVEPFGCFFAIKNIKKTSKIKIDLPNNWGEALKFMPNIIKVDDNQERTDKISLARLNKNVKKEFNKIKKKIWKKQ